MNERLMDRPIHRLADMDRRLARLVADEQALSLVAGQAYRHPNGFVKVPLGVEPDGAILRLHFWEAGSLPESNIHSHRWDMESLLLSGSYRAVDFEEAGRGGRFNRYRCSENRSGEYAIETDGETRLVETADRIYRAGDAYGMPAGAIHLIPSVGPEAVLSIVRCSPPRSAWSFVYGEDDSPPINPEPVPIAASRVRALIDEAQKALERLCVDR